MNNDDSILQTTKLHNALASHFFNQFDRARNERQQNTSRIDETLIEDSVIEEAPDSGDDSGMIERLKHCATNTVKSTLVRVHSTLALTLNLLALFSSEPLAILPKESYYLFFLVSVYSTYRYFYNFRSYEFLDFEDIYLQLLGSYQNREAVKDMRASDPYKHYFNVISLFADRFPGVHFEFKVKKRV